MAKLFKNAMHINLIFLNYNSPLETVYQLTKLNKWSLIMSVMEINQLIGTLDMENIIESKMVEEAQGKHYGK